MAKPQASEKFQEALDFAIFVAEGNDMTDREIADALRARADEIKENARAKFGEVWS